jgi:hypothetical protein
MKALYTFYAMEKGFVLERDRFQEFVQTQDFVDVKVELRRLPINSWPEGTSAVSYLPPTYPILIHLPHRKTTYSLPRSHFRNSQFNSPFPILP